MRHSAIPETKTRERCAMGWTEIGGDYRFHNFDEKAELTGTWNGTRPGKYGKLGIVESDGETVAFSLTKVLEDLEHVPVGTAIKIVYTGWAEGQKGGKYKSFKMYTDERAKDAKRSEGDVRSFDEGERRADFEAKSSDVPF